MKGALGVLIVLFFLPVRSPGESIRAYVAGVVEISPVRPEGASVSLNYAGSALILLDRETRFFRGIELELTVPAAYLAYQGSLALALYADLDKSPHPGVADIEARQLSIEPLPNKIQVIYQIPLRPSHGLRANPYASIPTGIIPPSSFPLLVRLMPVVKGLSREVETMGFTLTARPLLNDEGAVRINCRYPPQLAGKPFSVLIDDVLVEKIGEERLLKEGEHHLMVLSEDYRNESRRFLVERGKVLDLLIELQDPSPLIIFEAPENTLIYLDNELIGGPGPLPVEPGNHEVKFQVGDYSVIKMLSIRRGKTYRVALLVDVNISEGD